MFHTEHGHRNGYQGTSLRSTDNTHYVYLLVTRMYTVGGCTLHVNHSQHYMASLVLPLGHCVLNVGLKRIS